MPIAMDRDTRAAFDKLEQLTEKFDRTAADTLSKGERTALIHHAEKMVDLHSGRGAALAPQRVEAVWIAGAIASMEAGKGHENPFQNKDLGKIWDREQKYHQWTQERMPQLQNQQGIPHGGAER